MPKALELGTRTAKRPGSETSWVRRAPLAPIGFLVTWHRIVWPGLEHVLDPGLLRRRPALDVVTVVAHVAPVQDGVLGDADVDEGGLHARQHVLDPAPVDVAVDLVGVVGRPGHVVLDQGAALEHGDLGHVGLHVHADQVAAHLLGAPVPAGPAPAAGPLGPRVLVVGGRPGLARRGLLGRSGRRPDQRHDGRRLPWAAAARRAPGRVSPIFGLGAGAGRAASGGLAPPAASGGGPSGVWLISVSDMRESPPRVLCRAARRSRGRSRGAARTVRHRVRSIDAFDRPVRAPRRCPGPLPGRRDGRHAGAWPVPPGGDRWGWSRTEPGWPGGCRPRLDDPSAPAGP